MKIFKLLSSMHSLQIILLLAIVLFSFSPAGTQRVRAGTPPPNDAWQNAIAITNNPSSFTVDTTSANIEPDEPDSLNCAGINIKGGKATIWYTYTPIANELVSLDTLGSTTSTQIPNSNPPTNYPYDTYIAVYNGPTISNSSTPIACNDDNEAGYVSQLGFNATAGVTYYIQVAEYFGLAGTNTDPGYNGGNLKFHIGLGSQTEVYIGGSPNLTLRGSYTVLSQQMTKQSYALDTGPAKVTSANNVANIAALRDAWLVNGQVTSFAQVMGLPKEQLSDTYYFPAYNNISLSGQLRIANVDTVATDVTVTIAGVPHGPYHLNPNESVRPTYALDAGPVVVQSTGGTKIIAALRDAWLVNGQVTSFVELMGLPKGQLSDTYYFPAYNNVTLSGQLRIGNVDTVATDVTVTIAGVPHGPYHLNPNESVRPTYALDAGPVVVQSTGGTKIIAALRDAWLVNGQVTSFAQLMGLPQGSLTDTYLLPAYNNVNLSGQLRIGNVDTVATTVTVKIGGVIRGTYPLNPNASVRPTYPLDSGPVEVTSSGGAKIIVALRDAWLVNGQVTSFTQLMGLPKPLLSTTYWFPAYNNVSLSGQLRFGVP